MSGLTTLTPVYRQWWTTLPETQPSHFHPTSNQPTWEWVLPIEFYHHIKRLHCTLINIHAHFLGANRNTNRHQYHSDMLEKLMIEVNAFCKPLGIKVLWPGPYPLFLLSNGQTHSEIDIAFHNQILIIQNATHLYL